MSTFRISSGVSGRPRLGLCARQTAGARNKSTPENWRVNLSVNILHRPIGFNAPALNAVKVILLARRILSHPVGSRRLRAARLVGSAAHQRGGPPIPLPRQAEARHSL